ncbi:MAG TPA: porin, partial [Bacteroidetes bacterium]|nr:porin [Bacteroidota bacterium]
VSYFLSGEHRGYKHGAFSRTKPFKNFCIKDKEFGAFEVLARYSAMDYSNVVSEGIDDKVSDITLGLNWYLNSHTRLMYNFVMSDFHKSGDNNKLYGNLMRLQADF